jgi:hypothetical protein
MTRGPTLPPLAMMAPIGATDQNRAASAIDDNDGQAASAAAFIKRWRGVTASELSTAQSFVIQLYELLGVEPPHPTPEQSYMFERPITFQHCDGSTSAGRGGLLPPRPLRLGK